MKTTSAHIGRSFAGGNSPKTAPAREQASSLTVVNQGKRRNSSNQGKEQGEPKMADEKNAETKAVAVDEYSVRIVERDGFKVVQIRFKLDDGSSSPPFDFPPAYAHALSDELCKASAHAAP